MFVGYFKIMFVGYLDFVRTNKNIILLFLSLSYVFTSAIKKGDKVKLNEKDLDQLIRLGKQVSVPEFVRKNMADHFKNLEERQVANLKEKRCSKLIEMKKDPKTMLTQFQLGIIKSWDYDEFIKYSNWDKADVLNFLKSDLSEWETTCDDWKKLLS